MAGADLASRELPDARIACFVGMPGCGKTATSRARAQLFPRVLYIDTQAKDGRGEYPGLAIADPHELAEFIEERGHEPRWRVSYRGPVFFPMDEKKPNGEQTCEGFFDAISDLEDLLLVVEEAEEYMTADKAPRGIFRIARKGRRFGQALTLCAHRYSDIAKDLTAVADLVICWPLAEPGDRRSAHDRGFDLDLMGTLKGQQSIRRRMPEGERPEFYICRCRTPHSGVCGAAIPRPPLKLGKESVKRGA